MRKIIPRGRTPGRYSEVKTGDWPRSAQVPERPEITGAGRKSETSHSSAGVAGVQRKARPPDGAELMNRSTNQNQSQANSVAGSYIASHRFASGLASRTALLEVVGVSRCPGTMTERANAAGTTRGPVAQNATTTGFGRQRIGSLSLAYETFDGPFFSGNTQAITGHHFTEGEVYPRRTPAAAAGSGGNGSTKTICFYRSPVRAIISPLTQRMVIDLNTQFRMTMMSGVLYTDQTPQLVTVQPDEQCDTMSHSERVILARTFLCDKLPATDSLDPRTMPRLLALG